MTDREEELEEQVRQLKALLGCTPSNVEKTKLRIALGLCSSAAKVLLMLYHAKGSCLPEDWLALAIETISGEGPHPKMVAVTINKLRNAIGKDAIRTLKGDGYAITPTGCQKVKHALEHWEEAA